MPKPIKNSKLALIGLIILFAVSLIMANGENSGGPSNGIPLRQLSIKEILALLQQYRELTPESLPVSVREAVFVKKDSLIIMGLFPFKEITNVSILKTIFPTTHYYIRKSYGILPPYFYLTAISGNKLYEMPKLFNLMLLDNGVIANDSNIIELAKAFIAIAVYSEVRSMVYYPEITFLEGTRIKEYDEYWGTYMLVQIKCRIENQINTWKFALSQSQGTKGQLSVATVYDDGKSVRGYQIKTFEKEEGE